MEAGHHCRHRLATLRTTLRGYLRRRFCAEASSVRRARPWARGPLGSNTAARVGGPNARRPRRPERRVSEPNRRDRRKRRHPPPSPRLRSVLAPRQAPSRARSRPRPSPGGAGDAAAARRRRHLARASSAARSSSGTKPEPRVASSRGGSSSAGLEAVAGPKEGLGVGDRASPASVAAGPDVCGVSGTADDAGEGERSGTLAVTLSTSSANASKSYGSTVTSTRSALKFFPSRAEARAVSRDRPPAGSSSASGLILRASAISSSCSSGSASRRLRLVFGGITGVSGAFREARRRSSAPLVAAANPPTTSRPRPDRSRVRARRFLRGQEFALRLALGPVHHAGDVAGAP